ncbi:hypothetical protein SAMN03159408_01754 [Burkholderia sp. NFPP32]|nr:hypothetical protein SAMN03159408_01754 [Burkholderia sp. NFPP32]
MIAAHVGAIEYKGHVRELTVDEYVTQKRHRVVARRWLLRPTDAAHTGWRVAPRLPAT